MSGYAEEQLRKSIDLRQRRVPAQAVLGAGAGGGGAEALGRQGRQIGLSSQALSNYASGVSAGKSILIVEDEPLIAMMLEDFLLSLGHDVRATCDSVCEALKAVEAGDFDLAILDVNLKGESVWPVAAAAAAARYPVHHRQRRPCRSAAGRIRQRADDRKPYTIDRVTPALEAALAD